MKINWKTLGHGLGNGFDLLLPIGIIGAFVWVMGKLLRWWP